MATQEALCIPTRCSADRSTATAIDAAGIGSVTMRVTGCLKVSFLPRWSVTVILSELEDEAGEDEACDELLPHPGTTAAPPSTAAPVSSLRRGSGRGSG